MKIKNMSVILMILNFWSENQIVNFLDVNIKQQKFEPIYAMELYMFCTVVYVLYCGF